MQATRRRRPTCATRYSLRATLSSVNELFGKNSFVETMAGVKQHGHLDCAILGDIDDGDISDFQVIGHGAHRPLGSFENLEAHRRAPRQKGPVPAPWPKSVDR